MTEKTLEIEKKEEKTAVEKLTKPVGRTLKPRVDLFEADEAVMLVADLPGVREEDLEIMLEKDRLTISGPLDERAPEGYQPIYSEYCYGDFRRSFILSNDIDRDRIEASFENGVLRLSLPKAEKAKARRIAIQS